MEIICIIDNWTDLAIDVTLSNKITQSSQALTEIELQRVQKMVQIGEKSTLTNRGVANGS